MPYATDRPPLRQIRASFDARTIRVYQAYPSHIAEPALKTGSFATTPFRMTRMTWIKPSFLWMMYRSGWATKPGQERILGIDLTRDGFEWALAHGCLSHFESPVHGTHDAWLLQKQSSPVCIQWDPERDAELRRLDYRSLQVGLSGQAVENFVYEWTQGICDLTGTVEALRACLPPPLSALPVERQYPLPKHIAQRIGLAVFSEEPV